MLSPFMLQAMRECMSRGEFEQALREFRKARTLIEQANAPILHRVLDEGRKVVLEIELQLLLSLEEQGDSPEFLDRTIKQLQQVEESGGTADALHKFLVRRSSELRAELQCLARRKDEGQSSSHAHEQAKESGSGGENKEVIPSIAANEQALGVHGDHTTEDESHANGKDTETNRKIHGDMSPRVSFEIASKMIALLRERLPKLRRLLPLASFKGSSGASSTKEGSPGSVVNLVCRALSVR